MPRLTRGNSTNRISRAKTTNAPAPQMSSLVSGTIGPGLLASVAEMVVSVPAVDRWTAEPRTWTGWSWTTADGTSGSFRERWTNGGGQGRSETDEDEDHEPDQRERLGEGDAEEHGGAHHAG